MYKIIANDGQKSYGIKEYACDTIDDLATLPPCPMGSIAIVIDTAEVYMKNSKGEWVKL